VDPAVVTPSASAKIKASFREEKRMPVRHLQDGTTSVVVDARGPGLPSVVYWGPVLPRDTDLDALLGALVPAAPHNLPDEPGALTLVPDPAAYSGRPGLRGHRDGADWSPVFRLGSVDGSDRALHYTAEASGLTLSGELELTESGLLRLRHRVRNDGTGPYTVDGLEAALPVPERAAELLDFTGIHCKERVPQRHPFALGSRVRESRRGRTGHDATIGLLAGTPGFGFRHGEVWALHVAWSGNHVTYAEHQPDSVPVLGGGELLLPGEIRLGPGEEYVSPWLYAAYSAEGLDGISAAFHRLLRSRPLRERWAGRPRPVVLNTWEAVYFDHDLGTLRQLADTAARLGVERFVLDDGWFRHRRDDTAGLGDWYVDETVWPDGLGPLVEHVRGLGMEFGLWFEPEMVNPDSDTYRAHPDWALGPEPGVLPPAQRGQQVLDLTNPAAFEYVLGRMDALLGEYDIAFVKWDHNRDLIGAGSGGRAAVHAQTAAFYRLLDELRARHPRVEFESCSSGGARIDLEVLERADRVWTSDCNDGLERQAIQRWTGVFLPPELLGAHIGPPRSHTTGRVHDLSFRAATALFGHFGFEWNLAEATPQEQEGVAAVIALYKQFRELLHTGDVVRVDHPDPAAFVHGVVSTDRSSALFAYVQLTVSDTVRPPRVRLDGLDADRRYRLTVVEPGGAARLHQRGGPAWTETVLTGAALGRVGVQLPTFEPEQAWLLRLDAVGE
jgi:alpha-galactosidase